MAQNLDIQAAKILMAYLASGVEDQVGSIRSSTSTPSCTTPQ